MSIVESIGAWVTDNLNESMWSSSYNGTIAVLNRAAASSTVLR